MNKLDTYSISTKQRPIDIVIFDTDDTYASHVPNHILNLFALCSTIYGLSTPNTLHFLISIGINRDVVNIPINPLLRKHDIVPENKIRFVQNYYS